MATCDRNLVWIWPVSRTMDRCPATGWRRCCASEDVRYVDRLRRSMHVTWIEIVGRTGAVENEAFTCRVLAFSDLCVVKS